MTTPPEQTPYVPPTGPKPRPQFGGRINMLGSFPEAGLLPALSVPEIAFAGRSNVGKSSLINALIGEKIARTSGTPGRTQTINLFLVADRFGIADLPGYGFAKVPPHMREAWKALVEGYLGERPNLKRVILLIDARQEPQKTDGELIWGLRQAGLPFLVAATKYDKLTRAQRVPALATLRKGFGIKEHELVGVSSVTGEGLDALWAIIAPHVEAARR